MTTKLQRTTGDVFRDLGFASEEAEHLKVRAELMMPLTKVLARRGSRRPRPPGCWGSASRGSAT